MSSIFISHSSKDMAAATDLIVRLRGQGHRSVFLDFGQEAGILVGRQWERELHQRLARLPLDDIGTLWSDSLGHLQVHPVARGLAFEDLPIDPLSMDHVDHVIEGPIRVAGIDLEAV